MISSITVLSNGGSERPDKRREGVVASSRAPVCVSPLSSFFVCSLAFGLVRRILWRGFINRGCIRGNQSLFLWVLSLF